ncbi:uncharacterized protein [Amphiura filiformis]|uniref:uncharacterized protein n=1 Tax=Amphiura filiformis TaxID=82378 RepID=UPI003B20F1A9
MTLSGSVANTAPNSIMFNVDDMEKEICVEIIDDNIYENEETFRIVLQNANGEEDIIGTLDNNEFDKSITVVTIGDNDADICIVDKTYEVLESANFIKIDFIREGFLGREAQITVNTEDGTASSTNNEDFQSKAAATVTFLSGSATAELIIEISDPDCDYEPAPDENFVVKIAPAQTEDIGPTTDGVPTQNQRSTCDNVQVTIMDDDADISIKVSEPAYPTDEGDGQVIITMERLGFTGREQTFNLRTFGFGDTYNTMTFDAISGSGCNRLDDDCDFEGIEDPVTITFPVGETEVQFKIDINNDIYREGGALDEERFGVMIFQDDTNECINQVAATNQEDFTFVTINDDDAVIFLKDSRRDVGFSEYKIRESADSPMDTTVKLTLCREGDLSRTQIAYVRTDEISSLEGRARDEGEDFIGRAGARAQFAAGSDTAEAEITITNDEIVEPVETFLVTIYNQNEHIDTSRDDSIVTILDDDAKCTISPPSTDDVSEGVGPLGMCFIVRRIGYVGRQGSCDVKTVNTASNVMAYGLPNDGEHKIAVSNDDFYATSKTIDFAAGEDYDNTFCPDVRDDDDCELSENVYAVISDPPGTFDKYTQSAFITILDNEAERFRFFTPYEFNVNENDCFVLIRVYRCGDVSQEGQATLRFDNGTAKEGQDCAAPLPEDSTLVFPPWVSEVEANVTILKDKRVEGLEYFYAVVEASHGNVVEGSVSATINILDDDAYYSIEFCYYTTPEDEPLVVKVTRNSNYLGTAGSVDISTKSLVSAVGGDVAADTDGIDFQTYTNYTIDFAPFEQEKYVTIPIYNDDESEFSELFCLYLSNPDGDLLDNFESAIATILDDDDVYYQFEEVEYNVRENAGVVPVSVERYGSLEEEGRVRIEFREAVDQGIEAADQPSDYTATDTYITFPPGDHTAEVYFSVTNDNQREELETFGMYLSDPLPGEYLNSPKDDAIVYISDDDDFPRVTYSMCDTSVSVAESEDFVDVCVRRVSDSSYLPSGRAYLTIRENTATENQDFAVGDLVAYFGDGDVEANVRISIIPSAEIESTEIFTAILDSVEGGNAVVGFPSQTDISILDYSAAFNFVITQHSVSESQGSVVVSISRSGNTDSSASVGIVSVSGSATDSDDYQTVSSRVTFDRNEATAEYTIFVNEDNNIEGPERFTLRLVNPSDGTNVGIQDLATITILDSTFRPPTDPPIDRSVCFSFSQKAYTVDEDDGKVYFTIERQGPGTDQPGRVRFYTNTGSATPGQDYVSKDTLLFFEPYAEYQTVQVEILDYDGKEDQEFFTVHLSDAEGSDARVCDNGVSTVYIQDIVIKETLTAGIIIAIAVAGIILLLLLMAFLIGICFRPRARERENVVVIKRPKPQPLPPPPQPQPVFVALEPEPEPEPEEPEEVIKIIRRVRVPVHVGPAPSDNYGPEPRFPTYGPSDRFGPPGPAYGPSDRFGPPGPGPFGEPRLPPYGPQGPGPFGPLGPGSFGPGPSYGPPPPPLYR